METQRKKYFLQHICWQNISNKPQMYQNCTKKYNKLEKKLAEVLMFRLETAHSLTHCRKQKLRYCNFLSKSEYDLEILFTINKTRIASFLGIKGTAEIISEIAVFSGQMLCGDFQLPRYLGVNGKRGNYIFNCLTQNLGCFFHREN